MTTRTFLGVLSSIPAVLAFWRRPQPTALYQSRYKDGSMIMPDGKPLESTCTCRLCNRSREFDAIMVRVGEHRATALDVEWLVRQHEALFETEAELEMLEHCYEGLKENSSQV